MSFPSNESPFNPPGTFPPGTFPPGVFAPSSSTPVQAPSYPLQQSSSSAPVYTPNHDLTIPSFPMRPQSHNFYPQASSLLTSHVAPGRSASMSLVHDLRPASMGVSTLAPQYVAEPENAGAATHLDPNSHPPFPHSPQSHNAEVDIQQLAYLPQQQPGLDFTDL
jgi:hypothetical protein